MAERAAHPDAAPARAVRDRPDSTAALEETGYIPAGGGWLYSFLCRPVVRAADGPSRDGSPAEAGGLGVVLLAPLAEERKSSLRAFVGIARALAAHGLTCLRMDFRGAGDSSGTSEDLSLDSMVEDAVAAAAWLRESEGCAEVAFVGLRLGAAVALLASERARARALCLVAPIARGETYVREIERKQTIRRMLTRGKGPHGTSGFPSAGGSAPGQTEGTAAKEDGDGPFDLDGLAVDRAFLESLKQVDMAATAREIASKRAVRALVLQVGARRAASADMTRLAEAMGNSAELEVLVAEPFWLQTDYVDPGPALERLKGFLASALGVRTDGDDDERGEA